MSIQKPLISYSTDFGPGNKGHGIMRAVALEICPNAEIIELFTNVSDFNITEGARLFECVKWMPKGFHVCVVDPGVGTKRRPIIIETQRGDFLIGPDNGVLIPAARFLGGIKKAVEITNKKLMRDEISNVFHGRDVFMPAAAHLANGVAIGEFGKEIEIGKEGNGIEIGKLAKAPYEEAVFRNGKIECQIIDTNKFGNVFVNVLAGEMHKLAKIGEMISVKLPKKKIKTKYANTFGEVKKLEPAIMDDDFGRVEIALNQGSFAKKFGAKIGQKVVLTALK